MQASFTIVGPVPPTSPVVLSIPHAGRDYPAALIEALAVPLAMLRALEDRYVDGLGLAARGNATTIVQHRARAWIDLNRNEDERDPQVEQGHRRDALPAGPRTRQGLGLIPRRVGRVPSIWRRRFDATEIDARIAADHRPYHAALAQLLDAARERFGIAVLLDLHSMPPLERSRGDPTPRIVIGDRFGRSSAARFVARLEAEAGPHRVALNAPYAGGHVLGRHGNPAAAIHAIQLELDRTLYLDAGLDAPGPGFATTVTLVGRMIAALADEALGGGLPLAAE